MTGSVRLPQDDEEWQRANKDARDGGTGIDIATWIKREVGITPDEDLCEAARDHLLDQFDAGEEEVDLRHFVLHHLAWREANA